MKKSILPRRKAKKIDDLTFEEAMALYQRRMMIEETNDIKRRTQLLRECPDIFDDAILTEVKAAYERARALIAKKKN